MSKGRWTTLPGTAGRYAWRAATDAIRPVHHSTTQLSYAGFPAYALEMPDWGQLERLTYMRYRESRTFPPCVGKTRPVQYDGEAT